MVSTCFQLLLVWLDPYIDALAEDNPIYKVGMGMAMALLFFPLKPLLQRLLSTKTQRSTNLYENTNYEKGNETGKGMNVLMLLLLISVSLFHSCNQRGEKSEIKTQNEITQNEITHLVRNDETKRKTQNVKLKTLDSIVTVYRDTFELLQKEAERSGAEKEWASAYAMVEHYAGWSDSLNKANFAYLTGRKDAEKKWKIAKLEARIEAERLAVLEQEAQQWRAFWGYSLLALAVMALLGAAVVSGRLALGARFAEMLLFASFLILFETMQVFAEPFINKVSGGEPLWLFIFNLLLAAVLTPLHGWAEKKMPGLIFRGKRRRALKR